LPTTTTPKTLPQGGVFGLSPASPGQRRPGNNHSRAMVRCTRLLLQSHNRLFLLRGREDSIDISSALFSPLRKSARRHRAMKKWLICRH
jgi:hypothetical protein